MASTTKRNFTLVNALILVAATAIGLALLRPALDDLSGLGTALTIDWSWEGAATGFFWGLLFAPPFLVAWSLAVLVLILRRPRTRANSPGFVMTAAAVAASVPVIVSYLTQSPLRPLNYVRVLTKDLPYTVSNFVIGSAVALALVSRLMPRPDWTDRLAWALGLAWVLYAFLGWPRSYFFEFGE